MIDTWPTTTDLSPVVDSMAIRAAFDQIAKDRWPSRLDAVMKSRGLRNVQLALLADTTPQSVDKIRRGQIVPREYLRYAIAAALSCEVADVFPLPSRADVLARAGVIKVAS